MFVKDTFSGASAGSDLNTHTGEIGATWTKHASEPTSTILISSNGDVYGNTTGINNVYYASGTPASADYSVIADIKMVDATAPARICGRLSTAALTYYMASFNETDVLLYKRIAGTFTLLATASLASSIGQTYQLGLHMSGTSIKVTMNGAIMISTTDASIGTAGLAGIDLNQQGSPTAGGHLDNFKGVNGIYWVGGNGNIGDSAHWSRLPGGSSGVTPGSTDDAFIDQNSGSPTVTINAAKTFASLTIGTYGQYSDTAKTINITDNGVFTLSLNGDLTVFGNAAWIGSQSNINVGAICYWFQYSNTYVPKITVLPGGNLICGHSPLGIIYCSVTTLVLGVSAEMTLPLPDVGDLYASLNVGTLDTTNNPGGTRFVTFGNSAIGSEMHVLTKLDLTGTSITYTNLSKLIVYFDGDIATANLNSATVGSIHVNSGRLTLAGNTTANSLILERSTVFAMTGNNTFGYVAIASNIQIIIGANKTLTGRQIIQNYNEDARNVSVVSDTAGTRGTWNMNNGGALVRVKWRVQDIAFVSGSIIAYRSRDLGNNIGITFITGFQRYYRYAVSDFSGQYIGELPDVISDPSFIMETDSVPGDLIITQEVSSTDFGEGEIIDYDNIIEIICYSDFYPNGKTIYTGTISSYTPIAENDSEYLEITLLPFAADFSQIPVTDSATLDVDISQSGTLLAPTGTKLAVSWQTGGSVSALNGLQTLSMQYKNTSLVTVSVYKDNGSNTPDNTAAVYTEDRTVVNTSVPQNLGYLLTNIAVTPSSKYWVVLDTHGGSIESSHVFTTNTYASGNVAYWNGSSWVQSSNYGIEDFQTFSAASDTTVVFNAADLHDSLASVMDNYAVQGGRIRYSDTSLEDPGVQFTYTFISNTITEAMQKFIDQCPDGWYWYVDPGTNLLHLHPPQTTPQHKFTIGLDVEKFELQKTKETIVNNLYITGGDTGGGVNLFRNYINIASINRYRRRTRFYNDINLTDADAADAIGNKIVLQSKDPTTRAPLTILGQPDTGYDLELLRPGDLFVVLGKDSTLVYLKISSFTYRAVRSIVDASTVPVLINTAVSENSRDIKQQRTLDNPATATVVEVV